MEISQLIIAKLWLCAFILGAELGAVYDAICVTRVFLGVSFTQKAELFFGRYTNPLLRPLKRLSGRPLFLRLIILVQDFLFLVFVAISVILLFYRFNNGKIRIPVLICLAVGFLLYRRGPGQFIKPTFEIAAVIFQNACKYALLSLLFPFRKIVALTASYLRAAYKKHVQNKERKQRVRFTKAEKRRVEQNSCGML